MSVELSHTEDPLAFSSGWSLGEEAYCRILDELRAFDVRTVVEFGSGTSTLRLSRDLPEASILSIESAPEFRRDTESRLASLGGPACVEVDLRPIEWQRHGLGLFRSYAVGGFPDAIDAILIDGPPITTRRGREACLYQVFRHARLGARVYLDDYCREAEQQIVRNWLRAYRGSLVQRPTFEVDHRVAVLEKVAEARAPRPSLPNLLDSAAQTGRHLLGSARRRVRTGKS